MLATEATNELNNHWKTFSFWRTHSAVFYITITKYGIGNAYGLEKKYNKNSAHHLSSFQNQINRVFGSLLELCQTKDLQMIYLKANILADNSSLLCLVINLICGIKIVYEPFRNLSPRIS